MKLGPPRVLRVPGFRNLLLAHSVNELGDWLGIVALAVLVYDKTHNPLATTLLFLGTGFVPALLGPALVARVEPLGGRSMLAALYALEAVVFLALALLAGRFALAPVVVLATVDGALALAARSLTRAAAAAVLTPRGLLREGNALLNVGFTSAAAIGPAIGGIAVASLGAREALALDAASFVAVAILIASARTLPDAREEPSPWAERLRAGLRYVVERPLLRRILVAHAAASVFFMAVIPIEVVYAKRTLDTGDTGYGALLAAWGAGMVVGSVGFALARRFRLRVLLPLSALAVGAAYLGLAASGTLAAACGFSALGGAGNGVEWVVLMTVVQELTSERFQARVVGLLQSIVAAMTGAGFVLGGLIAKAASPRMTYLVAGLGVVAVVGVAAPLLRELGAVQEVQPEPEPGPPSPGPPAVRRAGLREVP
jgi:MFS family permease